MNQPKEPPRPRRPPYRTGIWIVHRGERHRIVAIEYQDGWPVNVLTEEHWDHRGQPWFKPGRDKPTGTCATHWDFDYSKAQRSLYFHESGGGGELRFFVGRFVNPDPPPALLWVAEDVPIVRTVRARGTERGWAERRVSDRELLRMGYRRLAVPRRLPLPYGGLKTTNPFAAGEEGETVWCGRCQDHLPVEDTYHPCPHIDWCDGCGSWVYNDTREFVEDSGTCDCQPDGDDR